MGEPNRGTLEYGKAGTGINKCQKDEHLKNIENMFLMLWGSLGQFKACNVSVAVLGVFSTPENQSVCSKEIQRGPGKPKYLCTIICVICWWSFGGKVFIPPPVRTLSLPPLLVCLIYIYIYIYICYLFIYVYLYVFIYVVFIRN